MYACIDVHVMYLCIHNAKKETADGKQGKSKSKNIAHIPLSYNLLTQIASERQNITCFLREDLELLHFDLFLLVSCKFRHVLQNRMINILAS